MLIPDAQWRLATGARFASRCLLWETSAALEVDLQRELAEAALVVGSSVVANAAF